jgi:hypothetical protein
MTEIDPAAEPTPATEPTPAAQPAPATEPTPGPVDAGRPPVTGTPPVITRVRAALTRGYSAVRAHPLTGRCRAAVIDHRREITLVTGGFVVLVLAMAAFGSCTEPTVTPLPAVAQAPPAPSTRAASPSPTPSAPATVTDACRGLISANQVAKATGIQVNAAGVDGAAVINGYADAIRAQGLEATVRLCPFTAAAGDQVHVMGLSFPDAAQATKMFTTGQAGAQPVPGVGDAAVTDGAQALMARRGRNVLVVYLLRPGRPAADSAAALRAVALEALPRL